MSSSLIRLVDASLNATEQVERLGAGERGPQVGLPGDVGEVAMGLHGLALTVDPEDLGAPPEGWINPSRSRMVVVFPAPFGPR